MEPSAPTETQELLSTDGPSPEASSTDELVADELLVEEISIDGMCGVY